MKKGLCGLYCFKNYSDEIIYIGKADDIHYRLKHHNHLPESCYKQIHHIEFAVITNKSDRDILELLFILKFKPKYNTQLRYNDEPTILITSTIMLFWQKEENVLQYNFHSLNDGIKRKTGRPEIKLPDCFEEKYNSWKRGEITAASFSREIGFTKATFYRKVKEYEKRKVNV